MKRRFTAAVEKLRNAIDLDDLAAALLSSHAGQAEAVTAIEQLADGLDGLHLDLHRTAAAAGDVASESLAARGITYSFDAVNPQAVAWAKDHAGEQIADLTDQSRAAVRGIIERAISDGISPREAAQLIRQVVGLDPRRAQALASYRQQLVDAGEDGVERKVADYGDELLDDRAMTIARTETIAAANQGQLLLWRGARDDGLLNEDKTRKQWIATEDGRTDEECATLDGQTVALDDEFDGGYDAPPAHPSCRCAMGLVFPHGED